MSDPLSGARWQILTGRWQDVLHLDDRSVDHVITDPPYEAEAHTKARCSGKGGDARKHGCVLMPIDFPAIGDPERHACGSLISRACKRWALVFCQDQALDKWFAALNPMRRVRSCVWIKPDSSPQFSGDRPACGYEFIALAHSKSSKCRWNGGGRRGVFHHGSKDPANRPDEHTTPKPLPLMLELVSLFTDPDDLILDPYCGSGTTGVACLRLGRRFIGVEANPEWAELARERMRAEDTDSTLRDRKAGQLPLLQPAQLQNDHVDRDNQQNGGGDAA